MNINKLKDKIEVLPDIFTFIKDEVKENFSKHGEEILDSSNGIAGIIVKLFAKDRLEQYFEAKKDEKLAGDGFATFIKASFEQVEKSLDTIKESFPLVDTQELVQSHLNILADLYDSTFMSLKQEDIGKSFEVTYLYSYPPIVFVRDTAEEMLRRLDLNNDVIDAFVKDFNKNIKTSLEENFTDEEYTKLQTKFKSDKLNYRELQFLQSMERLGRIGFSNNENLTYMPAFSSWKKISEYRKIDEIDDLSYKDIKEHEDELSLTEDLIDAYFKGDGKSTSTIKKMLFILSDFGKGKSTFLKHYTSRLASQYLRRGGSEYFPIYFNLNEFNNVHYNKDHVLGIIASYMDKEYEINLTSDEYKDKNFIFLIDSLDESGDLDKRSIENVFESINKIRDIDKNRKNRMILTSRPIDEAKSHLSRYEPHTVDNEAYYLNLHGFKSSQLNEWMKLSLQMSGVDKSSLSGFSKEIFQKLEKGEDIYEVILDKNLLKSSELQRPIFSYMMYKLILSDVDFSAIEKIGIYISFLNILTKDAKHSHDVNYKINYVDEFNFRNILHYIAVLWLKEKEVNSSSMLKKLDICRTIKGKIPADETKDNCKDVSDIKFLSHSYFGNDGDTLYFNHQSFAEMLIAEYYLKVFIKYALDDSSDDIEDARVLLSIGTPTEQTMEFFKELLLLLKDSTNDKDTNIKQKREMLVKFLISCSINKNNRVQSSKLYHTWYSDVEQDFIVEKDKTKELIESWPITENAIEKIILLAKDIIMSENTISFAKSRVKSSVFDDEVVVFQKGLESGVPDMDKWISLVVGNTLKTKVLNSYEKCEFFNADLPNYHQLFQMLENWNLHQRDSAPTWCQSLFQGIYIESGLHYDLSHLNLNNINFSYSTLVSCNFFASLMQYASFNYCSFQNVDFRFSNLVHSTFHNIRDIQESTFHESRISSVVCFPTLVSNEFTNEFIFMLTTTIFKEDAEHAIDMIQNTLRGFFVFGYKNKMFTKKSLLEVYQFEDKASSIAYKKFIQSIR